MYPPLYYLHEHIMRIVLSSTWSGLVTRLVTPSVDCTGVTCSLCAEGLSNTIGAARSVARRSSTALNEESSLSGWPHRWQLKFTSALFDWSSIIIIVAYTCHYKRVLCTKNAECYDFCVLLFRNRKISTSRYCFNSINWLHQKNGYNYLI